MNSPDICWPFNQMNMSQKNEPEFIDLFFQIFHREG